MNGLEKHIFVWNDYIKYRARLRGYDLDKIEAIIRHSEERYFDISTHRRIAIGRHDARLVMIPYEISGNSVIPVTIHPTTRQQIKFRLRTGRFRYE